MFKLRSSLKAKILFLIGSVIIILMLLISSVLLIKWRSIIIQKQSQNSISIAKTFTVTVIDAMILEEKRALQNENILETYIDNFVNRLGNIKYVAIFDDKGSSIIQLIKTKDSNSKSNHIINFRKTTTEEVKIFEHENMNWVLEVNEPLVFSGRNWGYTVIGFDAQPIRDEIENIFILLLIATILVTSIVLIILFFSINHMTSSLEKLVIEFDKVDFVSDVDISLPTKTDEIGFLYHHFSLLLNRVEASKKQLENAQKQIYQAEKLASIGRLASGVAHQVNNPLNGIKSCLYAIQQNPNDATKNKLYLELINEGINNIETVVKKLLGFARQQSSSENLININESIQKVIQLFDFRLKEKRINVMLELSNKIGFVKIDYHLFQEVIMNLLLNSYDAIEKDGTITITTLQEDDSLISLVINDSGIGISEHDIKKIFDPFFTTKEVGTGTGLGLSVCLGIIESHEGKISVQSKETEGTTFKITLPRAIAHEITNN
ncbi:MAG: ATP-binding protein [Melioribacteraceae bacterium]